MVSGSVWRGIAAALFVTAFCLGFGSVEQARANERFAALAVDARTGQILFSRNADAQRYPASLTKIMTLYVLFQELEAGRMTLETELVVSPHAASMQPSKLGLPAGATISVENAIKALVTKSANDIAAAVAEGVSGTEYAFAERMTEVARSLGMTRTRFRNASGLPNGQQVTTARDMATLGLRIQLDFPQYYTYFSLRSFTYRGNTYRNHNRLLGRYDGTDGIKTGYTRASGYNLTASVRRNGRHIIGVVMGGRTGTSRNDYMMSMLTQALDRITPNESQNIASLAGIPPGLTPPIRDEYPLPEPKPGTEGPVVLTQAEERPAVDQANESPAEAQEQEALDVAVADITGGSDPTLPVVLEAEETQEGSAPEVAPEPENRIPDPDTWLIQIGAFTTENDAQDVLDLAVKLGLSNLDGKSPFTVTHHVDNRVIYRARFSGFDRSGARTACEQLIRRSINCFALAPGG